VLPKISEPETVQKYTPPPSLPDVMSARLPATTLSTTTAYATPPP
jgi:hypothetical protein